MKEAIYFIVIVVSNTIGAVAGMGGGVIIKPVLDFMAVDSVSVISFYSSVAVFVMSIVSTIRQIQNGISVQRTRAIRFVSGAWLGGVAGNVVFTYLLDVTNESIVQYVQIVLTVITLIFVLLYRQQKWQSYNWESLQSEMSVSFILGFLSSLLGIGGGPINVALLMLCFALPIKAATVYSIIIICASQFAKLASIGLGTGFAEYPLALLWVIIPAAIIGGIIGAQLSRIWHEATVDKLFQWVVVLVILINLYNAWRLYYIY